MHAPTCIFWANLTPFTLQLEDGTSYGYAPGASGAQACQDKCSASASCSAFLLRVSDSLCFWKSGVTASTMSERSGYDCHSRGVTLAYPTVSDNSGEELTVVARVGRFQNVYFRHSDFIQNVYSVSNGSLLITKVVSGGLAPFFGDQYDENQTPTIEDCAQKCLADDSCEGIAYGSQADEQTDAGALPQRTVTSRRFRLERFHVHT